MCGIAGFIDFNINYAAHDVANQMGNSILHRGPDSSGIWCDNNYGLYLIHRRLSILDLSTSGHQPMLSKSGRYVIAFNGEIYNYKTILSAIEAKIGKVQLCGHSDTEVLLLAFEVFGLETTLSKLEGMFAIAFWDREVSSLYLIRDRVGEKPLYYGYFNGVFAFSSELSSFKSHPKFVSEIDRNALGQLMLHNCIPAPLSIYNGINKLESGKYLHLNYENYRQQSAPQVKTYWDLSAIIAQTKPYQGSLASAAQDLDNLLSKKISEQMVADVPLGCFLSGGVDSSLIAALMQKQSSSPIKTFCIGFDNPQYNEAKFAKEVAKHLKTDHHELYVTEHDALEVVNLLPKIYSEPFADSSQIPTFLVSKMAREHVTVCLSGDGGDEIFAGYNRYVHAPNLFNKASKLPKSLRKLLLGMLPILNPNLLSYLNHIIKLPITNLADKVYKIEMLLRANEFKDFYFGLTSHWTNYNQLVINDKTKFSLWDKEFKAQDNIQMMQYLDTVGYMSDDILVKVDRAAMANSLETRAPFVNHEIIEFACTLPLDYKITGNTTKNLLREVLYQYVPRQLIERPKMGFAVPLNSWLRGPLKAWACDLLSGTTIKNQGYFDYQLVNNKLQEHMNGKKNNGYLLWDILMFQAWLNNQNGL